MTLSFTLWSRQGHGTLRVFARAYKLVCRIHIFCLLLLAQVDKTGSFLTFLNITARLLSSRYLCTFLKQEFPVLISPNAFTLNFTNL